METKERRYIHMKISLRIASFILILAVISSCAVSICAAGGYAGFIDVSEGEWYADAVKEMKKSGIMRGVTNDRFDPDSGITRGMAATVLMRLFSWEVNTKGYENPFNDVLADEWYTDGVLWASHFGIVLGRGNGKFDPNANVTRAEFCTMLVRYFDFAGLWCGDVDGRSVVLTDEERVPDFALEAMTHLAKAELINLGGTNDDGVPCGKAMPDKVLSRAECAVFISRVKEKTAEKLSPMLQRLGIVSISASFWEDNMPQIVDGPYDPSFEMRRGFALSMDLVQLPGDLPLESDKLKVDVFMTDKYGGAVGFALEENYTTANRLSYNLPGDDRIALYGCSPECGDIVEILINFTYDGETESVKLPILFEETW